MSATAAVQAATIDRFIAGWKKLSAKEMLAPWSDDATQQAMPFSLGHPPRTRAQVEANLPKLEQILTNYSVSRTPLLRPVMRDRLTTYKAHYSQRGS